VHPARKYVQDAEEIACEFLFGTVLDTVENHEFSTVPLNKPFEQFEAEPAKPVSVGDDKSELIALHEAFQNGTQSTPLEVEAGPDIPNDVGSGKLLTHLGDLADEIVRLLCRTDPAVADEVATAPVATPADREAIGVITALPGGQTLDPDLSFLFILP